MASGAPRTTGPNAPAPPKTRMPARFRAGITPRKVPKSLGGYGKPEIEVAPANVQLFDNVSVPVLPLIVIDA